MPRYWVIKTSGGREKQRAWGGRWKQRETEIEEGSCAGQNVRSGFESVYIRPHLCCSLECNMLNLVFTPASGVAFSLWHRALNLELHPVVSRRGWVIFRDHLSNWWYSCNCPILLTCWPFRTTREEHVIEFSTWGIQCDISLLFPEPNMSSSNHLLWPTVKILKGFS